MKKIVILTFLSLIIGCSNTTKNSKYNLFEDHERDIVFKNKIHQITEIKIGLDTAGNSLWKRTELIKFFNKDGLLIMTVLPKYLTRDPFPKHKSGSSGFSLNDLNNIEYLTETNIPNGDADTVFYEYDNRHNLISRKENDFITTYKYDINNNCTEKCWKGEYSESSCNYSFFEYNKENQIITKTDSFGVRSNNLGIKVNNPNRKLYYKYDKLGRVIFDGEFERVFNDKNQLTEVSNLSNKERSDKFLFFYDKNGLRVKKTWIEKSIYYKRTSDTYFFYNEKGLLREAKVLNEKNTLTELKRYEYSFY